jgi:CheY-like chemotaxis protein
MLKEALLVPGRGHGVLVADDDAEVRDAVDDGLRREGFAVWLAADGQEALDVYHDHCETIDVVLLDVCMPGLDGPQTLAALQELTPQIRCCFMTGCLGSYTEQKLRHLGADEVFMKPFRLSEVAQVLRTMTHPGKLSPPAVGGALTACPRAASAGCRIWRSRRITAGAATNPGSMARAEMRWAKRARALFDGL